MITVGSYYKCYFANSALAELRYYYNFYSELTCVHSTLVNSLCTVIHSGPRGSSIDGMRTARSLLLLLLSLLLCLLLLLSVAPTGSQLNRPGYDLLQAQRAN
jgi:hypothetical protein